MFGRKKDQTTEHYGAEIEIEKGGKRYTVHAEGVGPAGVSTEQLQKYAFQMVEHETGGTPRSFRRTK